ncbi:MAG: BspA family leucine-rich repeat surface protein [Succinivibrionaceae bacterium]|nr:BspA family leucine-rich repeat surface protein [Succinivibrionaceae bacterium]
MPQKNTTVNRRKSSYSTVVSRGGEQNGKDRSGESILDGKYTLESRMDVTSGEADLYLCADPEGRTFVAKLYRRSDALKKDVLQLLAGMDSPYVASPVDYGAVGDTPVTILPYFRKGSLLGKTFSLDTLKSSLIPSINEGLRALHEKGMIHKDIKPSNLMLSDDGKSVKIIDFGISSVLDQDVSLIKTTTGISVAYSAPETFSGTYLRDSDYYSLGITLYELYAGHHPFRQAGDDDMAAVASLMRISFPEDFPQDLRRLISGLTYKDLTYRNDTSNPNRRWGYQEIKAWLNGEALPAPGEQGARAAGSAAGTLSASGSGFSRPYKLGRQELNSIAELVAALGCNWVEGKKHVGRGLLSAFLSQQGEQSLASLVMDCEAEETASADSREKSIPDISYFKLLLEMNPDSQVLYWKDMSYSSAGEFAQQLLYDALRGDDLEKSAAQLRDIAGHVCERNGGSPDALELVDKFIAMTPGIDALSKVLNYCLFIGGDNADILAQPLSGVGSMFSSFEEFRRFAENPPSDGNFILQFFYASGALLTAGLKVYLSKIAEVFRTFDDLMTRIIYRNRYEADYASLRRWYSVSQLERKGVFTVSSMLTDYVKVRTEMEGRNFAILHFEVLPMKFFASCADDRLGFAISIGPGVTSLSRMFDGCARLKSVPMFDTSRVADMSEMFRNCEALEFVPKFDTSSATDMTAMFAGCKNLEEIPDFSVASGAATDGIASGCGKIILSGKLPEFLAVKSRDSIFHVKKSWTSGGGYGSASGSGADYGASGSGSWTGESTEGAEELLQSCGDYVRLVKNIRSVELLDYNEIFFDGREDLVEALRDVARSYGKVRIVSASAMGLFSRMVGSSREVGFTIYLASAVTSVSRMFSDCYDLVRAPEFDTSHVTDMDEMFYNCQRLVSVPHYNTSRVVSMRGMFDGCTSLKNVPRFDTSRLAYADRMFYGCAGLVREPDIALPPGASDYQMYEGCTGIMSRRDDVYVFSNEGRNVYVPFDQGIQEGTVLENYNLHRGESSCLLTLLKVLGVLFLLSVVMAACQTH